MEENIQENINTDISEENAESLETVEETTSILSDEITEEMAEEDPEKGIEVPELEEETEELSSSNKNEFEENEDIANWEEIDSRNNVVKKYLVYISRDFVPIMDNMNADQRSAYLNDAIQKKIDLEDENKIKYRKRKLFLHLFLTIFTIIIIFPVAILVSHKAILMTLNNYKYSQESFEKLYKQKFKQNRAYMRSLQYNEMQAKKERQKDKE